MNKRSKLIFLVAALGVVLLACIPVYIILHGSYDSRLEGFVGALGNRRDNLQEIDEGISALYAAENNFRIYTLTGEKLRAALYRQELGEVSALLDSLSGRYAGDSGLVSALAEKRDAMAFVLEAKRFSDSLWSQALYLETHPDDLTFYRPGGSSVRKAAAQRQDSALVQSYLVYRRKHKGLLGRLKDAILDYPDSSADSIKAVHMIGVVASKDARVSGGDMDTSAVSVNLWSGVLNQLNAARGGLRAHDLALLRSNEYLFNGLKNALAAVRGEEFRMIRSGDLRLASRSRDMMAEFRLKKRLTAAFILLLGAIILVFIWQFYRNGETLIEAKRNAEQFAHLKASFAATVSHEVRGLTHAINASVEALNEKQPFGRRKELLHNMKQSWEVLLQMLNNILDYTRMEQKGKAASMPFSPAAAMSDVVRTMKVRAEAKSLALTAKVAVPEDLLLSGNESQFKQILINLVGNAIKFTARGSVSVTLSYTMHAKEEAWLTATVADTGRGIAEKHLSLIFEEFQQVDHPGETDASQGSGLGLAIVKRIVDQHGGRVTVKSKPGEGSAFSFTVPYKISRVPRPAASRKKGKSPAITGLRVLAVENELLHRKYLTMSLKGQATQVLEAPDGVEALRLLETTTPDIVLTDIHMPGMSGLELARAIRSLPDPAKAAVPIVALTATLSEEDVRHFREAGMTDYLIKPFTPADLAKKLAEVLTPISE